MQNRKKQIALGIIFLFLSFLPLAAQMSTKIDLQLENSSLKQFIAAIEDKTDYTFMYNNLDLTAQVSLNSKQVELGTI